MNIDDYMRGNWAFLQLQRAYKLLLEYENSHLLDRGDIPPAESGPRLYLATISMAEVMKDREYLLEWVDLKLADAAPDPLVFMGYLWACRADVEHTLLDISARLFSGLSPNLNALLRVRQDTCDAQPEVLSKFRAALRVENKAISGNVGAPKIERDYLVQVITVLADAYCNGRHRDGVLKRGVIERARREVAAGFGLTENQAEKIWNKNKDWLNGRVIKGSDGAKAALKIDGRRIVFILFEE